MYTKTTKRINITVNPIYLEDQSEPDEHLFVWAYQVTINNLGKESVQLKNLLKNIEIKLIHSLSSAILTQKEQTNITWNCL